jgi:copper resistance protein B
MNTRLSKAWTARVIAAALSLAVTSTVQAQHAGHEGHVMPPPAPKPAPKKPAAKPAQKPAAKPPAKTATAPAKRATPEVDHAAMGHGTPSNDPAPAATERTRAQDVDHAAMGHGSEPVASPATPKQATDHEGMDHGAAQEMDHAAMGHGAPPASSSPEEPPGSGQGMDHSGMDHGAMQGMDHAAMGHRVDPDLPADAAPRTPIPPVTEADRVAAVPPKGGHTTHGQATHSYWLADRLEWQDTEEGSLAWEGLAWIGGDIHRLWLRTEGEASDGEVESGDLEVLYGRGVSAWWDVVAGVRQDFGEGPSRTYAAFGVQGLAPYKFEVEATAYVGSGGRTAATLEAEYETLITNRLILQWMGEVSLYGKDDPENGVGSGFSTVEAGARLRYEITRQFAPYIGVEWERAFGGTADLRREHGEPVRDSRLVAGIRFWF